MNLTPKSWNMQSEINAETAQVGDTVYYTDICNCIKYEIIEVTDTDIVIQDAKDSEWIDVKTFARLNNRWTFSEDDRASKEMAGIITV